MARGGDDSDEERHDRFRSERDTTSLKPSSGLESRRVNTNSTSRDDWRTRDRRRSRDRERSRSKRSRDRSSERKWRNSEDRSSHKRRSSSKDREDRKKKTHKGRSRDELKGHRRGRDGSSSDRNSDSFSSHDSRGNRKSYKHSRRSKDRENDTAISRVDTYVDKFERRRESSVEEEVVDNHVVYRDSSASPEPSKHKKKKNGEKQKKKEKRKDKKKKKKSKSIDKCDESQDSLAFLISPEQLRKLSGSVGPVNEKKDSSLRDVYGPAVPHKNVENLMGPTVPSCSPEESLPGNRDTLCETSTQLEKNVYGPLPPTNVNRKTSSEETELVEESSPAKSSSIVPSSEEEKAEDEKIRRVIGPVLLRAPVIETGEDDASYGPALPPRLLQPQPLPVELDEEEDDGGFGPLPAGLGGRTQEELEIRAALIKRQLGNKEEDNRPKKREDWMTVLPDAKRAAFGLGPRQFRAREGPDMSDRSSWTDTPEDKKRREELTKLGVATDQEEDDNTNSKLLGIIARDKEMEKKAREKKKEKSLMDIHQKELKKKKKKEEKERAGKQEERRPFSRDVDLQTNRFDEAQKKSIIKKAQLLDSRFSKGESKYL